MPKKWMKYQKWEDFLDKRFINNPEEKDAYIELSLKEYEENKDLDVLLYSLKNVARSMGWKQLEKETGITRQALCKALSVNGNPTISTLQKILKVMGYTFSFQPIVLENSRYAKKIVNG
ncbi:MAG: transcriptional regulator [Leptospiraceae bacterium]|nr:hypothetical protein [Leptospiraceae bacterium]MCP5497747.1 transcriptional regulator [Leptospiraceae bacterium]